MKRYLERSILEDSANKIILLSGPRQAGKTTLTKQLFKNYVYLNYDSSKDREAIIKQHWLRNSEAVIFDELHKMPEWKRWIKGIYDTEGTNPRLIITGSANLESFTKVGDSLAGRFVNFRLHPIDLKEGTEHTDKTPKEIFESLMNYSGFPEPFLANNSRFYRRWSAHHIDVILRQDFLDIYAVKAIKSIEILTDLLKTRVGGGVSLSNLANDLQVDSKTIKNWLQLLENFYIIFRINPYHTNIARALLKEPKYYFFDIARVQDIGAKLENLVACALLKEIQALKDMEGFKTELHYLRTKDGAEIDFLITLSDEPIICFEVKTSDSNPSKNFRLFRKYINVKHCVQLMLNLDREFDTADNIMVRDLVSFLSKFNLMDYLD
jgi:predicted AAA+ superfamily ATPase